jgi:hypothetical protein
VLCTSASDPVAVFKKPKVLLLSASNPNALLSSPLPSGSAPAPNAVLCAGAAITVPRPSSETTKNAVMETHKALFIDWFSFNRDFHF